METVTQTLRIATATCPVLDDLLREGAREMLQRAIEREVAEYVGAHAGERDPATGRRLVVRNGHLPASRG
jgi:transposase-like protein